MKKLVLMCLGAVGALMLTGCCGMFDRCNETFYSAKNKEIEPRPMMVGKKWSVNETYTGLDRETSRVTF